MGGRVTVKTSREFDPRERYEMRSILKLVVHVPAAPAPGTSAPPSLTTVLRQGRNGCPRSHRHVVTHPGGGGSVQSLNGCPRGRCRLETGLLALRAGRRARAKTDVHAEPHRAVAIVRGPAVALEQLDKPAQPPYGNSRMPRNSPASRAAAVRQRDLGVDVVRGPGGCGHDAFWSLS